MKNKPNILLICALVITFITICFITYFYNKTKPLKVLTECTKATTCEISTDYDQVKKEMLVTIIEPDNIMESWQQELSTKEHLTSQLLLPKTDFAESLQYASYKHEIFSGQNLSVEFRINGILPDDYLRLKKHIKVNANTKSIQLVLPNLLSTDNQVTAKLKNEYLKQKELERIAEEKRKEEEARIEAEKQYAKEMTYWYDQDGTAIPYIDTDFRKCLFKVKGICFGQPFFAKGMSYMDCKAEKDKLGIKACYDSDDIWATTVKICGGIKNVPTPEDLRLLAEDLYNTNISNTDELKAHYLEGQLYRYNVKEELQRENNRKYLDYIRDTWWNTDSYQDATEEKFRKELGFIIYSNQETEHNNVMVRRFSNKYTDYGSKERTGTASAPQRSTTLFGYAISGWYTEIPISICKAR